MTERKKKWLIVLFPIAVVFPVVVVSFLIGVQSIWLWIGVGVGMIYLNHRLKKRYKAEKSFETEEGITKNPWAERYVEHVKEKAAP